MKRSHLLFEAVHGRVKIAERAQVVFFGTAHWESGYPTFKLAQHHLQTSSRVIDDLVSQPLLTANRADLHPRYEIDQPQTRRVIRRVTRSSRSTLRRSARMKIDGCHAYQPNAFHR